MRTPGRKIADLETRTSEINVKAQAPGGVPVPAPHTLRTLFPDELRGIYDAERQPIKALLTMARAATLADLKGAFETHLRETKVQANRVEKVFKILGERVRGKHCEGMAGILKEGLDQDLDRATLDAALIAAAQPVEHYEVGACGTVVAWADVLDLPNAAELLQESLDQEGETNKALTSLGADQRGQQPPATAHGREARCQGAVRLRAATLPRRSERTQPQSRNTLARNS
jgi:ferritin-like metal-binding protein YciE